MQSHSKPYLLIILFAFCIGQFLAAQESSKLYINTKNFKIKLGSEIYINGSLEVDAAGNIDNGGKITITDSLINHADGLFMPSSYGKMDNVNNIIDPVLNIGYVTFNSDSSQIIVNHSNIIFDSINIAATDSVVLFDSVRMVGQVEFVNGLLNLNENGLLLYYKHTDGDARRYGTIGTERIDSRIVDSSGIGFIEAEKNLSDGGADRLNSIGIEPDGILGITRIKRYHYHDTLVTDTSIAKVYEIDFVATKGSKLETGFKYLEEADVLSSTNESELVVWNFLPTDNGSITEFDIPTSFQTRHPNIYMLTDEEQTSRVDDDSVRGDVIYKDNYRFTLAERNCDTLPPVNLGSDTVFCTGNTAILNAFDESHNWQNYLYKWGSDVTIGGNPDANVFGYSFNTDSVVTETDFKIWVKVRDYKGCTASDTINVIVHESSPVNLRIFKEDMTPYRFSVCQGEPFVIVDTNNADTTIQRYTWWFEGDTLNDHNCIIKNSLDIPGDTIKFGVRYENQYGCVTYKNTGITVNPLPTVNFTADKPICVGAYTQFNNNSYIPPKNPESSIVYYSWILDDLDTILVDKNSEAISSSGGSFISKQLTSGNLAPDLQYQFTSEGLLNIKLEAISSAKCTSFDSIEIYVNPAVVASFTPDELSNVCKGQPSVLYPDSDCTPVNNTNYSWQVNPNLPWVKNDTISHLFTRADDFNVTLAVVSDSGCVDTVIHQVSIHPNAVAEFTVSNHCFDSTTFVKNNSVSADNYYWNFGNGSSSSAFEHSLRYDTAGTYQIKLISNNEWNCIDSITKPVVIYPLPTVSFDILPGVCINEQKAYLNNTSDLKLGFYWTFGDGTFSNLRNPNKKYSAPNSYGIILTGTDSHGCKNSDSKPIVINDIIKGSFNTSSASVCQGNASIFNPNSGMSNLDSIKWIYGDGTETIHPEANPNASHTYNTPGFYLASMVTISDSGCSDTTTTEIIISPNPEINIVTEGQNCENSELVMRLENGTQVGEIAYYTWNFGDGSFSTIPVSSHFYQATGNYSVSLEAITQQGCIGYDTITINIESLPEIAFGDVYSTCETSLELIAGSPANTYLWHNGSTDSSIIVTQNGEHSVTVTNPATGCSNSKTTYVELAETVNPRLGNDIEACDFIVLDAHYPGGSYLWSTGDTSRTLQVSTSGNYIVQVTDVNQCEGSDTISVTINNSPQLTLPKSLSFCDGDIALINSGSSTGTFEWSTGETTATIDITEPGYYWVRNTDNNGCSDQALTNVVFNPIPNVRLGDNIVVCEDKTISLNAGNPGSQYIWNTSNTTQVITPNQSGEYSVEVTNSYGCINSDTIQIVINSLPIINLGGNQSICDGQDILLDAGSAQKWYWSTYETTQTISVNKAGDYWVRVTDGNNCTNISDIIEVDLREKPLLPFETDYMEACNFALLDAGNSGSTYLWQSGDHMRNFYTEESGIYWVEITNAQNCSTRDSVEVYIKPQANVNLPATLEICSNSHDFIDAGYFGDDFTYQWNTGSKEQYIKASSPGWYKVDVIHNEGCVGQDSTYVISKPAPQINLPHEALMCAHSGLMLDAGNSGSLYSWENSKGIMYSEQIWEVTEAGTYWVYVMAENGCANSDTTEILHTNMSINPYFMVASQLRIGDTVRFVDLSMPEPDSYLWEFGNLITSFEKEPTHIYLAEDTYNVRLTVTNDVCSASVTKPLTVSGYNPYYLLKMGLDKQQNIDGLIRILDANVYPNPAVDNVTLRLSISEPAKLVYYMYNMNGQIIKMERFNGMEEIEYPINVSGLSQGMYFIMVVTRNESKTFKLLKVD